MIYVKTNSSSDLLSEQTSMMYSSLSSNVGTLKVGDVYKRFGYVTVRIELVPKISIVGWQTEILQLPEPFRPCAGMYSFDYCCYIYPDTGIIKSAINFEPSEGTLVIYSIYPVA